MSVTIITNRHPREVLDWLDLSDKERAEFNYDSAPDHRFVRYKNWTYDLHEFLTARSIQPGTAPMFKEWDGYHSDSFFSGIVVKYDLDQDWVVMGTYISSGGTYEA